MFHKYDTTIHVIHIILYVYFGTRIIESKCISKLDAS